MANGGFGNVPRPAPPSAPTEGEKAVDPEVFKAFAAEYAPAVINGPDKARGRAQAAWAIASAIATAVAGLGLLTDIDEASNLTKALVIAAVAGWLGTGLLFAYAVSSSKPQGDGVEDVDRMQFVSWAVQDSSARVNDVRRVTFAALLAAVLAIVLTAGALAAGLFEGRSPAPAATITLDLTRGAGRQIVEACPLLEESTIYRATLLADPSPTAFAKVSVPAADCALGLDAPVVFFLESSDVVVSGDDLTTRATPLRDRSSR